MSVVKKAHTIEITVIQMGDDPERLALDMSWCADFSTPQVLALLRVAADKLQEQIARQS